MSDDDPLSQRFRRWRADGHRVLIPYITAGYPEPATTLELLRSFAEAGADVIELGVPFSDPLADGPTIQRASYRAIQRGGSLEHALETVDRYTAEAGVPVVLFSYLNPILRYGPDRFLDDAHDAGAQGVLITDLPLGSDPALEARFEDAPPAFVRLIAPTTPWERALAIAARAQGFVYYISRTGVTGATTALREDLADELRQLREAASVPVAVGFGISGPEQARSVAAVADGVVVGSALIDALDRDGPAGAAAFLRRLRSALDEA